MLHDWLKKFAPLLHHIKISTNSDSFAHLFLHIEIIICFFIRNLDRHGSSKLMSKILKYVKIKIVFNYKGDFYIFTLGPVTVDLSIPSKEQCTSILLF